MNSASRSSRLGVAVASVFLGLTLIGCGSYHISPNSVARVVSGVRIYEESVSFIQPGVTTRQSILTEMNRANFGRPQWTWPTGLAYTWATSTGTMTFMNKVTAWQQQTDHAFAVSFDEQGRAKATRFFLASDPDKLKGEIELWLVRP